MNEQQRNEMSQIILGDAADRKSGQDKKIKEKTSYDSANYYETQYEQSNINKASKRGRDKINVHYDFGIPEDIANIGEGKKFLIRTYGCQMNEHDTEVMAGILTEM